MNAEFNWWLLIVGLVVGAGLVWLVIADWSRREEDVSADEQATESEWIAEALRGRGEAIDPVAAAEILALHREYLRQTATPDDAMDPDAADWDGAAESGGSADAADWAAADATGPADSPPVLGAADGDDGVAMAGAARVDAAASAHAADVAGVAAADGAVPAAGATQSAADADMRTSQATAADPVAAADAARSAADRDAGSDQTPTGAPATSEPARPSVRSAPLSPRGASSGSLESEPPTS